jgi:hypothetical protein
LLKFPLAAADRSELFQRVATSSAGASATANRRQTNRIRKNQCRIKPVWMFAAIC